MFLFSKFAVDPWFENEFVSKFYSENVGASREQKNS